MDEKTAGVNGPSHRTRILITGLVLAALVCAVMLGMAWKQAGLIERQVHEEANALFDEVVMMRRWNSGYGGVYVKKQPGERSNKYINNPDIIDQKGGVYTIKPPAVMTREVSGYAEKDGRFRFHITSLKLKNPENRPDDWERSALAEFEKGRKEVAEVLKSGGRRYYRLMRPLYVEESCISCHRDQDYRLGDVRGGISVTLPYDRFYAAAHANYMVMAGLSLALVGITFGVIYLFVWRLAERMATQRRELESLNETKDTLLGMAAHDLRNPLVVVGGYAELLHDAVREKSHRELVEGIQGAAEKMLGLINDILDVSKINRGRLLLEPREADVAEFVEECRASNEMIARKKGITLTTLCPEDVGSARFDSGRMRQAMDNLISNALKFSNAGTTVVIGAGRDGDALSLWVEDQGVGIAEGDLSRIFEAFSKAGAQPTMGEPSHGLGLAITKRVVELHGGRVDVVSAQGKGSRFTITIPARPA